jgi:hypothetical protein
MLVLLAGGAILAGESDWTYLLLAITPFLLLFAVSGGWMLRRLISNSKPTVPATSVESVPLTSEPGDSEAIRAVKDEVKTQPKAL